MAWIRIRSRREFHPGDIVFRQALRFLAGGIFVLIFALIVVLLVSSWPILQRDGLNFFIHNNWNPVTEDFGALAFVYGTVVSSLLALVFAIPVSMGVALFLTELAPDWLAQPLGFLVEMLAAIPSVVYGLWGVFVLAPVLRESVQPWLGKHFGFLPLFTGPPFGVGMLAAGVILAIMIVPTISAISREIFRSVGAIQREGALALGATRWESISLAVIRSSYSGVIGAVMLGLGRALGETMAVTMVIGNRSDIKLSLFAPGQTMASAIANEYAEAVGKMHTASLTAIGLALLIVSLTINGLARALVWNMNRKRGVVA